MSYLITNFTDFLPLLYRFYFGLENLKLFPFLTRLRLIVLFTFNMIIV